MKEIINLSNHLGNVLVTVSDKRECDNGLMMANDFEKVSKEGWREYGTTISIDAGKLYATLAQSAKVYKNILTVPNQSYTLLINQDASSSAIIAQAIAINSSQAETNLGSTTLGSNGSYSFTFTATTTNTRIELINSGGSNVNIALTSTYVLEVATTGQFKAEVLSATDYSAFGAPLPGRTYTASSYRYGFKDRGSNLLPEESKKLAGTIIDKGFSQELRTLERIAKKENKEKN